MELEIPRLIELYNESVYSDAEIDALPENKMPSNCIGCKACEAVCPQNIEISKMMGDFAEKIKR